MDGLGPRFAIERAKIGNSRPTVARACALLDLLSQHTTPISFWCPPSSALFMH
jgi:hypothetical protein